MSAVGEHGTVIFIAMFTLIFSLALSMMISQSPFLFAGTRYEGIQFHKPSSQFFNNTIYQNITWLSSFEGDVSVYDFFPLLATFGGHYVDVWFEDDFWGNRIFYLKHYHGVLLGIPIPLTDVQMLPVLSLPVIAQAEMLQLTDTPYFIEFCPDGDLNCTLILSYDVGEYSGLAEAWSEGHVHFFVGISAAQKEFNNPSLDPWVMFWAIVSFQADTYLEEPIATIVSIIVDLGLLITFLYIWDKVKPL